MIFHPLIQFTLKALISLNSSLDAFCKCDEIDVRNGTLSLEICSL
jgi:hypothetical protein